jgi:hypothetical protein
MPAKRSLGRILSDMGKALIIVTIVTIGAPLIFGLAAVIFGNLF